MLKVLGFIGILTLVNVINLFLMAFATNKQLAQADKNKLICWFFILTGLFESYLIYTILC